MSEKNENVYDLSFFMPGKTIEAEEIKVPISKRFVDKKGMSCHLFLKRLRRSALMNWKKKQQRIKMSKAEAV